VLELGLRQIARLGPDIMRDPPATDAMLERFRRADQGRELGDALLDQTLVSGIGNKWKAEALFEAGLSPWERLRDVSDEELTSALEAASRLMRGPRRRNRVYRRAGRPCQRCAALIRSRSQGDDARIAYWCPACQAGTGQRGS
jgi:endonuclease-8